MVLYQREALSVDVGGRLRELRESRGISMRTLATRSGLSANALSMIERGKTSPSVSTLYKLADALGVAITAFFGPESDKKQVIFLKADERPRMNFSRGMFEGLGGENFIGRVMPFLLTLEGGSSSGPHDMVHTGHEFVFCLRGQLEYKVEREVFLLTSGDSLLFASQLKHRWRNTGNTVANALIIISGFAEGEQPHAMHWKKEE
ncbi:MAG: helix-turn-helix domain-containing protein [Chloroflexi bacterium]|nr:helix-turn-helix domain-containing protein [Chloroflexota bacterium]